MFLGLPCPLPDFYKIIFAAFLQTSSCLLTVLRGNSAMYYSKGAMLQDDMQRINDLLDTLSAIDFPNYMILDFRKKLKQPICYKTSSCFISNARGELFL